MRKKIIVAAACILLIMMVILIAKIFKGGQIIHQQTAQSNPLTLDEIAFPDPGEFQLQTRQNPDETPTSIIDFARSLGPQLEKAQHSKIYAMALFGKLEDCALNQKIAATRAVCTIDAGRILDELPDAQGQDLWNDEEKADLNARVEHLRQSMPSDVQTLIESLE